MGFPGGSLVKYLPANVEDAGDVGLIPGSGRSLGVGNGNPLVFCLKKSMAIVHEAAKSRMWLSD